MSSGDEGPSMLRYRCRFTHNIVLLIGSCNDIRAFQQSGVHGTLEGMGNGFYLLGDGVRVIA